MEDKYRSLFYNLNYGIAFHKIVYDSYKKPVNYIITDVNPRFETILSLKKEDVLNKIATEAYSLDLPPYLDIYAKVAETLESIYFEVYFEPMKKYFKIYAFSLEKGTFITQFEDITELELVKQELMQSHKQLESILSNIKDPILVISFNYDVLFANQDANNLLQGNLVDSKCYKVIKGTNQPCKICPKKLFLTTDQCKFRFEHIITDSLTKKKKFFDVNSAPIENYNGEPAILEIFRDITKQKKIEKKLIESEENLRKLNDELEFEIEERTADLKREMEKAQSYLNIAGVIIVVIKDNEKITLMNKRGCEILGYEENEIIGKNWFDTFIPKDTRNEIRNVFKMLMEGKVELVEYYENPVLTRNGDIRIIAWHNSILKDEEGNIIGTLSSGDDITERKKADEKLLKNEESLANAQKIAHLGNWDWNILKNELFWSDEIYRIFGLNTQEFNETYEAFLNSVHPDDREFVKKSVNEALYERKPYNIDHRIVLPDGSKRIVHEQAEVIFDENGKAIQMNGIVQDITDRRRAEKKVEESEKKYRSILESIKEAYLEVDLKGNFIFFNDALCDYTGYSRDELYGMNYKKFMDKENIKKVFKEFNKLYKSEIKNFIIEYEIIHKSGKKIPIENSVYLKYDSEGNIIGFYGLGRDITERKKLEQLKENFKEKLELQVKELAKELAEKKKLAFLGEIAGAVGHELRNPLASMKNSIYYLSMILENPTEDLTDTLKSFDEDTNRMNKIISDLLDYSRMKSLDLRSTNINDFFKDLLLRLNIPENITVNKNFQANISNIFVDKVRLEQILRNLITNAFEAMENGGELTIGTSQVNDEIEICIKDTGKGIESNNLKKIFKPFFTTKAKGFGLGLAIVKRYIEAHNASISVQSQLGQGTTFKLEFPIIKKVNALE